MEVSVSWYEPERSAELGIKNTVTRAFQYSTGLFTEPLFGSGSLPELTGGQGHTVTRKYATGVKGWYLHVYSLVILQYIVWSCYS